MKQLETDVVVVAAGSTGLLEDSSGLGTVLVLVGSKHTTITGNRLTVLDDDNVTGNEVTSLDLDLVAITNNSGAKSDTSLELGNNVTGLLLLVPTDESVKH